MATPAAFVTDRLGLGGTSRKAVSPSSATAPNAANVSLILAPRRFYMVAANARQVELLLAPNADLRAAVLDIESHLAHAVEQFIELLAVEFGEAAAHAGDEGRAFR